MRGDTIALVLASPVLVGALYWIAVVVCEFMAARAAADGVDDWQDLFWPRLLKRLDHNRYERMHKGKCK